MAERDLNLPHLFGLDLVEIDPAKTTELRQVADAFIQNVLRIKSLALFPLSTLAIAGRKERFLGAAIMRVTGDIKPIPQSDPRVREISAVNKAIWRDFLSSPDAGSEDSTLSSLRGAIQEVQGVSDDEMVTPLV